MRHIDVSKVRRSNRAYLEEYQKQFLGKKVELLVGKYKGRTAIINAIHVGWDGGLDFLCMVTKVTSDEFLNSDGETRSYRPPEHFRLLPE